MKHKISLLILILIAYQSYGQSKNQESYANSITADELKEKLYTYASDEFQGRETGTKGLEIAIDYLKNHYTNLEVNSAKSNGDYFQKVPLTIVNTPEVSIKVDKKSFSYYNDFISIEDAQSGRFRSKDIILVGYGIEDEKYNDYEGLDVKGKIIVAIGGEPKDENGNFIVSGNDGSSKWSNGRQELRAKSRARLIYRAPPRI